MSAMVCKCGRGCLSVGEGVCGQGCVGEGV